MQYHARHAHRRILYDDMEHHPSYEKLPSKVVEVLNGRVWFGEWRSLAVWLRTGALDAGLMAPPTVFNRNGLGDSPCSSGDSQAEKSGHGFVSAADTSASSITPVFPNRKYVPNMVNYTRARDM
jgi:hypothetical protein